jgi:hypothetical protein
MKRFHATVAAAALFGGLAFFAPAIAAPPTVARLRRPTGPAKGGHVGVSVADARLQGVVATTRQTNSSRVLKLSGSAIAASFRACAERRIRNAQMTHWE